jgi:flagellar biogenesis protein FliO
MKDDLLVKIRCHLMDFANAMYPARTNRLKSAIVGIWNRARRVIRHAPKRLRLCESLPLGERRFVAVVEFEGVRFLLGGTATSLVLLSRLAKSREGGAEDEPEFLSEQAVEQARNLQQGYTC